ncbi:MAG: LysR family transcriptional regulator [Myxococcota bacterium]
MERKLEWLNYHHLQCFWLVCRRGGLVAAGRALSVTPSTVWAQMKALEARLGVALVERRGRRLVPTAEGERVARIADDLFALGQEVLTVSRGGPSTTAPARLGMSASVPRFVSAALLEAPLRTFRLRLVHGSTDELLHQLSAQRLDAVLTDEPLLRTTDLGATAVDVARGAVALYGVPALRRSLLRRLPRSLDGAPLLLPAAGTSFRAALDEELARLRVRPRVVAEVDDSALLKALAAAGHGLIAAPSLVADELHRYFGLTLTYELSTKVSYRVVTLDPRHRHPAVQALVEAARRAFA